MTREEAIKALKWFKKYNEEDYCGSDRIQDEIGNWYYLISEKDFEAFELAIKALEQEPRWIPVSDRLPNLDDYTGSRVWQKKVLITGYLSFDDTKELFVSEAFVNDVINNVHDTIIKAWMPLPQPYEVESEDKE